ncbi:MAG: hypothetical protein QM500_05070 [Methylococcales bacterium]
MSKHVLLTNLVVVTLFLPGAALPGPANTKKIIGQQQSDNIVLSVENVEIKKNHQSYIPPLKTNPAEPSARKTEKNEVLGYTKTLYFKAESVSPVPVNKTGKFVFRNITPNDTKAVDTKKLSVRVSNIDILRQQQKSQ